MSEDEAARQRQQEINLFAAMANADNDRGTFDFGAIARGEVEGVGDEEQALHNSFKDNENDDNDVDGSRKLFAQAAQEGADSMGTFAFTPTTDNQSKDNNTNTTNNKRSNLEAAAAALDREDNMGNPGGTGATTGSNMDHDFVVPPAPTNLFVAPKLKPKTPMHTQQVFFPRPLVFGSQLPPRVLEQSKQIAKEALDECVANNNSPLPPDVCNLVSAIHMYGNGINILDSNEQNRSHVSSYVSVFCPKWSEVEETPLQDLSNDEPENIGNNNTATGQEPKKSSLPVQMAPAESTQEQPALSTAVGQSSMETATTTTAASSVSTTEGMSERDLFSLFARGEVPATTTDDDDPILSTSVTSSPTAVRSTITTNSSTTTTTSAENAGASTMDDAALFSQWARGESGDGNNSQGSNSSFNNTNDKDTKSASAESVGVIMDDAALFSQWARGERGDGNSQGSDSSMNLKDTARASSPTVMSDQDLFSQWARGEASPAVQGKPAAGGANSSSSTGAGSGTLVFENSSGGAANSSKKQNHSAASNFFTNSSGTFMNVPSNNDDSDDDSVVGSELKKKVGVNEHLNAALASLEDDDPWHPGKGQDIMLNGNVETESNLTSNQQIPLTKDGGRPLTNHELMNGCTPLFGVDDSPLPTESDLGIHETRDEQQRSRENRKNQAIIENCCPKNVFGPLACPNPALHPDDNHSWNSRSTPSQRLVLPSRDVLPSIVGSNNVGVLPSPSIPRKSPHSSEGAGAKVLSPSSRHSASSKPNPLAGRTFDSRQRFGWWNLAEDYYNANKSLDKSSSADTDDDNASDEQEPLQLPPWEHGASSTVLVQTRLEPQPEKLHEQNRPLSHMHPATSLAQALPFLSDRPPSYRYLQVDTQAVGFPALGGEIEPLFCSLAIYHVETLPHQHGGNDSLAPIPDLQRCGKITETLNFDVVSDANIEKKCDGSLYPYSDIAQEQLQGTRCGVFPLPSNLNIHNLYAILIVHKVISDGEDFEVYLKKKDNVDIGLLRSKAEKASNRHGQFIMPFAFGVAPLLQVFGADVPVVPSSRAVQIPLFRFAAGHGERQIIDHIMVMLYPRADHRSSGIGGPAPVTNGGIAMLVMRNFGYLGLHSVVHSKSSLARNRLVDFTGEMQLRCREDRDEGTHDSPFSNPEEKKQMEAMADVHVVPEWHNQFVSEPTEHGGRNPSKQKKEDSGEKIQNHLYAQELAPLPLHSNPSARSAVATSPSMKSQRGRASSSGDNIEPYYHTTFCNELLCHPRLLHNCPKGNTVIKVEMREMEWKPEYNAFFAHLPESGPFIHNPRRGPFLVSGAYTCCSAKSLNPHFLDEFKLKLPLVLKSKKGGDSSTRVMSLFFSVYKLSFSKSRKKWGRRLRGARRTSRQVEEIAGDMAGESSEGKSSSSCQLVQLACGHLPLASNYSIISNGDHDIKLCYTARNPRREPVEKGVIKGTTLVVTEMAVSPSGDADTTFEDAESVASCPLILDTTSVTSASDSFTMSESSQHGKQKPSVDRISLQVSVFAIC